MAAGRTPEYVQKVPYQFASACRWAALAAGRERTEALLGPFCVETHLQALQSTGQVPQEISLSLDAAITAARSAAADASMEAAVAAVAEAADRAVAAAASAPVGTTADASAAPPDLLDMARGLGLYWWHAARQDGEAERALALAVQAFGRCYRAHAPWRGCNLGGWLLLEPGPASPFFDTCHARILEARGGAAEAAPPRENPPGLEDEHQLCVALEEAGGPELRREMFARHRETHYGEATFDKIAACGLNAVRLPFGHWVVGGPGPGEAYEGPCLDAIDRAVQMADARGLQVLLDLHGNPGGESGDRPCGRKNDAWRWEDWRQDEAVELLRLLAKRYCGQSCVTGMQVCNEPSMSVPVANLCTFYERAVEAIREGGMGADRVTVVLPIFDWRRMSSVIDWWYERGNFLKFDNVAFDVHYYHQFSFVWGWMSQGQHLQMIAKHARELKLLPGAVVGEWSISRPGHSYTDEEKAEFAKQQIVGYNHASHGWFFWNWHDHDHYHDWDFERGLFGSGMLPTPLGPPELEGVLFPEWEEDSITSVPRWPPLGIWPFVLGRVSAMTSLWTR